MVKLVGKEVGNVGFGMMGMTLNAAPLDQCIDTLKAALENGANFWNGGEFYGPPDWNSLHLIKEYFTRYPEDAEKVVISIKGAMDMTKMAPDGTESGVRRSVDECLRVLDGKKKLDIFECARVDQTVPIEETIDALAQYVKAGKLGGICLSEASANSIRRAAKVHKIEGVELELSMQSTDLLYSHREISETCAELNIPVIAYSPLGRGFLTGQLRSREDLPQGDVRLRSPRFQPGNFEKNVELADKVASMAGSKGVTVGQYAIAWVRAQGQQKGMPTFVPIPGASTRRRVEENMKEVQLTSDELQKLNEYVKAAVPAGERYPEHVNALSYGDSPEKSRS